MAGQQDLIRRFEPVLRFGTDAWGEPEQFFPMAAHDYVHACGLRRRGVGWLRQPGATLLKHLVSLSDPQDCYLVYAAGDLGDTIKLETQALVALLDSGLQLAQVDTGEEIPLEQLSAASVVIPRLLVTADQSARIEAALAGGTEFKRYPATVDEFTAASGLDGDPALLDTAEIETSVNLEWIQFPALSALPHAIRDRATEKYAPYRDWNRFPPVYHYRISRDRGYTVLQYWFLYPYNDWAGHGGHNDHEGDWEVIYVFLDDWENARYVAYSKHVTLPFLYGPDTAVWPEVEKVGGTHPVVYVGCGSHASYLDRGPHRFFLYIDRANGDHLAVGPDADQPWGEPISLQDKLWNSRFSGAWGALVKSWLGRALPHTKGPSSPAQKGDKWTSPAKWAGIPAI